MDDIGCVRIREDNGLVDVFTKVGVNRWHVAYLNPKDPTAGIEGHVSDPVATRWPVFYRPKDVEETPK